MGEGVKRRVAVLTTHPIQYQTPWFRQLAGKDWIEPHVMFGSRFGVDAYADREFGRQLAWDLPMLEGYSHEFLENRARQPSVDAYWGVDTPDVDVRLRAGRFDAVLALGWHTRSFWQGFRAARRSGLPLILRGESNLLGPRPLWKTVARHLRLRPLFRRVSGFLAIGKLNREFYLAHGVEPERIHDAPYFVDHGRFEAAIPLRRQIREKLGVAPADFVFVFSGKLAPRKRPGDLLEAWNRLPPWSKAASRLLFIGDGALRAELERRVRDCGQAERIRFLGFRNQVEMPGLYAAADALVMPSDHGETWGLSANEAMATGARVIVSDRVGCGADLIRAGVTGEIFPCGDLAALRGVLQRYVQDGEWVTVAAQRKAVIEHAAQFSMERSAEALQRIFSKLPIGAGSRNPSAS